MILASATYINGHWLASVLAFNFSFNFYLDQIIYLKTGAKLLATFSCQQLKGHSAISDIVFYV